MGNPGVPDVAACLDMLSEISEEADALPHSFTAPEFTSRYHSVHHWLSNRTPLPEGLVEGCLEEPSSAAFVGMKARGLISAWHCAYG